MEFMVLFLLLGGVVLLIWGFLAFLRGIGQSISEPGRSNQASDSDEIDGMNNGDYYNGPHCYSPMTGYPETQYGSGFDEGAEWHEEH